ncbi:Metallo-dependent hydrolase [Dichomitus squalens]|uniref:adenosine deaminase n=1 Tax=Dichomitus squalens TaxID=114155 RepID=A0A4Q9QDK4_9APHY|nr:Metallo-dependent hydrolase [Dichomitus squalens]
MDEYLKRREEFIQQDQSLRPDRAAAGVLSSDEHRADEILRSIRKTEARTIWGHELNVEHYHGSKQMFPGMEFLTARQTIITTKLFDILSKMPKGGLLHAHLDATVRPDVLLRLALSQPAVHIRAPGNLTLGNLKTVPPEFRALPQTEWTTSASVTEAGYVAGSWVPIHNARSTFSEALGGPEGFDRWVTGALTIDPSEAYGTHNTTDRIWDKFESIFGVSDGLFRYVPIFKEYIREFLLSSVDDGISYVEPRILFWYKYMVGEDGVENVPHRVWFQIYESVLADIKADLAAQGRADEFVGSKIIYSTMRELTLDELEWYLEDCLALKQEFPHLVAGFDLVGHEDSLKPLIDYVEPFMRFKARQQELGVEIPFIFHAGETLGDGTKADMNLYDAILLGTKRIGHGFSIFKHPEVMKVCRERNICLEMCPISNEILRLTGSMPMHPLPSVLNHGVHVALCSDDPSAFGNMGLSFDYFQVFVASEVNGLATLRQFVWDSITASFYSCLGDQEKKRAFGILDRQWAKFINDILDRDTTHRSA